MKLRQAFKYFPIKRRYYKTWWDTEEFTLFHFPAMGSKVCAPYNAKEQKAYKRVRQYLKNK